MSTYDMIKIEGEEFNEEVKLWTCEMRLYRVGDKVPDEVGYYTYSIALRNGKFANVENLRLVSITEKPLQSTVFDKWGEMWFGGPTKGLFGEAYVQ